MGAASNPLYGLENLFTALYKGDPESKRAERESLIAKRRKDAELTDLRIGNEQAKRDVSRQAATTQANLPDELARAVIPDAPNGFVKSGGIVQPQAETADMPGINGGYRDDRYTPDLEKRIAERVFQTRSAAALPGKSNVEQVAHAEGAGQNQNMIADVLSGLRSPEQVSSAVAAGKGAPLYHETNGRVLNLRGGDLNEEGSQATASVGATNALAGERTATAGVRNAQAASVRSNTLPQIQVPAPPGMGITTPTIPVRGADVSRAATRPPPTATASTVGQEAFQDPSTGKTYQVNKRTGASQMMLDDGMWQNVNPNELPKNLQKIGNIGAAGARENVFLGRVGLAAGQATRDLDNIAKMPLSTSSGVFGGRTQGHGLLDAGREVFANKVTGQEAQLYNTRATGFQRNLAAIEAAGLMPNGTLTKQMDSIIWKEGDTEFTKLDKLAQIRQIVDAGLEHILANPRVSESEKKKMEEYRTGMAKSVPYTHADLDEWAAALDAGEEVTLGDFLAPKMRRRKTDSPAQAVAPVRAAPAGAEPTATGPNDEKVVFRNGQWVPLK